MGNFDYEPGLNQQSLVLVMNLNNKDQTFWSGHSVSRHVHQCTRRVSLSLFEGVKLQSRVVRDKAPIVARVEVIERHERNTTFSRGVAVSGSGLFSRELKFWDR